VRIGALPPDFAAAVDQLLEAFVAEMNVPLFEVIKLYERNPEFKRRIDLAALSLLHPQSETIH
jgi:hypothetical protein